MFDNTDEIDFYGERKSRGAKNHATKKRGYSEKEPRIRRVGSEIDPESNFMKKYKNVDIESAIAELDSYEFSNFEKKRKYG